MTVFSDPKRLSFHGSAGLYSSILVPIKTCLKETILDWNNTEGTVTLSDGNVLRVEYTPIIMTKGGGFTFD